MIVWPDPSTVREEGLRGLEAFNATSAPEELEASRQRWHVVSWPWNDQWPMRVVLENDDHDVLVFTLDEDGIWSLAPLPVVVHERTPAELEAEADAVVLWDPAAPPP